MNYINQTLGKIKNAKSDDEIKDILLEVSLASQWDSSVRAEFDKYQVDKRWSKHIVENEKLAKV